MRHINPQKRHDMAKQIWKAGTVLYPLPAVMVSCGTFENSNIVTVAWTGIINTDPPMTYISLRESRHSYDIIKKHGEFVINTTNKALVRATDFCGVKSGRDVDKFKHLNLTKEKAPHLNAPMIGESPINLECKVTEIKKLGSHTMFMAEIVGVCADEKYMDKNGRFAFERSLPICYSHGEYYSLGEKLGFFGYSIKKKKKGSKRK